MLDPLGLPRVGCGHAGLEMPVREMPPPEGGRRRADPHRGPLGILAVEMRNEHADRGARDRPGDDVGGEVRACANALGAHARGGVRCRRGA